MSDRELLELAAKAHGDIVFGFNGYGEPTFYYGREEWYPLNDDGDALRLAVKLNLAIGHIPEGYDPDKEGVWVLVVDNFDSIVMEEPHGDDPYAATRRAIVRAAAEIGRMK